MNLKVCAAALTMAVGVALAPVGLDAEAVRPRASFDPRFEKEGGVWAAVAPAADGGVYVAGVFSSIDGVPRSGVARILASGAIDPSFVPPDFDDGEVRALAVQPDGRLIVGGKFRRVGATTRGGLARLHADGSLDTGFATGIGVADTAAIHAIAVQGDGRVVVAGRFFSFDGFAAKGVARLLANGTVDTSFVAASPPPFEINAVVVRLDGRIVIGGSFQIPTVFQQAAVYRLLASGALDPSFDTGEGFTAAQSYSAVHVLLPDANNRLIVGGGFNGFDGTPRGGLARLNEDGSLDATFNSGAGFSGSAAPLGEFRGVTALARQGDGSLIVGGVFTHVDGTTRSQLARLTAGGVFDVTFDPQGPGGPTQFSGGVVRGVSVLTDGRIVAAGAFQAGINASVPRLFRFDPTGAVDSAVNPALRAPAVVHALVRDSAGRFIAGGNFTHVDGEPRGRIARLTTDGSLDAGYAAAAGEGFNGTVTTLTLASGDAVYAGGEFDQWGTTKSGRIARLTPAGVLDGAFAANDGFSGPVHAIALQSDGRVIVGGEFDFYQLTAPRKRLARLEATGAIDAGFVPDDVFLGRIHAVLPQTDGRIILGGNFQTWPGVPNRASLARVNADGTFDETFGAGAGGFYSSGPSNPVGTVEQLLPGPGSTFYAIGSFSGYVGPGLSVATHHVARLTADGAIDGGFVFPLANGNVFAALAQPDGRLVLGGTLSLVADRLSHGIVRVLDTGALDSSLDVPPHLATPYAPAGPNDAYRALALSAEGDLVAGGPWLRFAEHAGRGLVRFEPAPGPQITAAPQEQIAQPGDDVTFSVSASGAGLSYQWFHDGVAIDGATGASLTLTDVDWTDAGAYMVAVRDAYATVTTDPVLLRGPHPLPVITSHPGAADVAAGQSAILTVAATGTGPFAYHWRFNGGEVAGATGATLTRASAAMSDAGWYDVVVADGLSVATSRAGRVVVRPTRHGNAYRADTTFAPRFEYDGGLVTTVAAAPDGSFLVAGEFTSLDQYPRHNVARFLASGAIDPGFTPPDLGSFAVTHVAPGAGGRVYVAGGFTHAGSFASPRLVRLDADGSVDTGFDIGLGFSGQVHVVLEDALGRVLVGGVFTTVDGLERRNLVRLLADGSVDPTFVIGTGFDGDVTALAFDSTGLLVVGGLFATYDGTPRSKVARLQADGALDATFAIGANDITRLHVVAPQADGRVLVGGWFTGIGGTARRMIARFHADGTLDAGFDTGERFDTDVVAIQVLGDGRMLVTGRYHSGSAYVGPVVRLNSDGTRDATFVPPASLASLDGRDGARLADGRVVVVVQGSLSPNPPPYQSVVLLGVDGALDTGFAPATRVPTAPGSVLPTAGEKWIVAGGFSYLDGTPVGNIARLNADGTRDASFVTGTGFNGPVGFLAAADDGAIYAAGGFTTYDGSAAPGLARVRADGTLDPGFRPSSPGGVDTLAVRPDGRIWVGGEFPPWEARPGAIARLDRTGAVDPSFAAGIGLLHTYHTGYPAPGVYTTVGSVWALLPGADGGVLVGGAFSTQAGVSRPGIARFLADGAPDLTFDPGAGFRGLSGFDTVSGSVLALETLSDGRLVAGGSFHSYDNTAAGNLVRLASNGALDTAFNAVTTVNRALLVQGDGKVLVAGTGDPQRAVLARLLGDGSFDPAFTVRDAPADYVPASPLAFRADGAILASAPRIRLGDFTALGLVLLLPDDPPTIVTAPQSQTATAGGVTTLTVVASSDGPLTYQWQHRVSTSGPLGGAPLADTWADIAGATGASYTIPSTQAFHGGTYRVVVTAGGASTASEPVTITVDPPVPSDARLLNLSTRGLSAAAPDILIPGFVIRGTGEKRLLIRAVGPTLGLEPIGLGGTLIADPKLTLKRYNVATDAYEDLATNDDWGTNANAATITTTAAELFAFGLKDAREAALLMDLGPGQYTVHAGDKADAEGLAIVELYDADPIGAGPGAHLVNLSNRGYAGAGDLVMIPGFVISAEGPKTLLIRVVGPGLSRFGVDGVMADPILELHHRRPGTAADELLFIQDDWGDSATAGTTVQAAQQVEAFALEAGSRDAAFVVTLAPGVYTVVGRSADGASGGIVLTEVYVVE